MSRCHIDSVGVTKLQRGHLTLTKPVFRATPVAIATVIHTKSTAIFAFGVSNKWF